MSTMKIVSYDRLGLYDENIKNVIINNASTALALSRQYTDNKVKEIAGIDPSNIYTKTEVDAALSEKSEVDHNHDSIYDALGSAEISLGESKSYTDTQIASEASARNVVISSSINTHNTSTSAHSDIRTSINNLQTEVDNKSDVNHTHEIFSTSEPSGQNIGDYWMMEY